MELLSDSEHTTKDCILLEKVLGVGVSSDAKYSFMMFCGKYHEIESSSSVRKIKYLSQVTAFANVYLQASQHLF